MEVAQCKCRIQTSDQENKCCALNWSAWQCREVLEGCRWYQSLATLTTNLISILLPSPVSLTLHDWSGPLPQCDWARNKIICSAKPSWLPSDSGFVITHPGLVEANFNMIYKKVFEVGDNINSALTLDQALFSELCTCHLIEPSHQHDQAGAPVRWKTQVRKPRLKAWDCPLFNQFQPWTQRQTKLVVHGAYVIEEGDEVKTFHRKNAKWKIQN